MEITDLVNVGLVVGAINVVLGFWVKSRIDGSIKHEYDKALEKIKSDWKRTDILFSERMVIFKFLQKKLVSMRRYCVSQISSENGSEFFPNPDDLEPNDNKSILTHWTELETLLDENLIFLSSTSRKSFEDLQNQLSIGASMELWLASSEPLHEVDVSKVDGYKAISDKINECIDALYKDIGFPNKD